MKNLKTIAEIPQVNEKVHESIFRAYYILEHILIMVNRGDSKETINEVAELLNESER